jgi:hypothetical protein
MFYFSGLFRLAPANDICACRHCDGEERAESNPEIDLFYVLFFQIASACTCQ